MIRILATVVSALVVLTTAGCSSDVPDGATYTPPALDRVLTASEQDWIDAKLERERSDILADYPGTEIPESEFVRLVTLAEWPNVFADCLREAGWDVEVSSDGGIGMTVLQGQDLPYRIDSYLCNAMYPIDPAYEQPLTAEQLRFLYDYQAGELTECLRARKIHVEDPPSLQVFVETYGEPDSWNAYNDIDGSLGGEGWDELNAACPQIPPEFYAGG